MPLRDHFRPPLSKQVSWEGFHGLWPATILLRLKPLLPPGFTAEPRVHLGSFFEIDVSTYTADAAPPVPPVNGGVATVPWTATKPALEVEADWPDQYEYEVLVFDQEHDRRLVAAVELVSPGNKDRPESRRAFVTKCATLLKQGVALAIVDLVSNRQFNLYADLLDWIGSDDPGLGTEPPSMYAVALRFQKSGRKPKLQTWSHRLVLGQPMPTLPLWLTPDLAVPLELEMGYEDACRGLGIIYPQPSPS